MRDYIIWAERALLGAVLLDPAGQHEVLDLVELGDMFRSWHAQVLAAMQRVRGRGVLPEPVQVYQELRSDPDLPASVSADAVPLAGLMEATPRAAHAPAYAVMVVEGGIRQRLDLAASRMVHASGTGELEAALCQAAHVRGEMTVCQARWLALPEHLRSEPPAPGNQVRGDTGLGPRVEAVPEGLARPEGLAAEAAGARALRDLAAAPTQLAQVCGWLRLEHFAQAGHGELYAVMQDMNAAGKLVDAVTITWEAARRGVAADPGSLAGGTGPFAVASAREVHRYGMLAQAAQIGKDIQADAASLAWSMPELLQFAADRLRALEAQPQPGSSPARDAGVLARVRSGPVGSPRNLDARRCDDQPCRFRSVCWFACGRAPGELSTNTGDSDDKGVPGCDVPRTRLDRRADMTFFISAGDRLRQAGDLAAVLDAAYEAFDAMRLAFRASEDPATGLFASFVMAAAAAADGRDAVAFAPSLPARRGRGALVVGEGTCRGPSAEGIADAVGGLSQVLAGCLVRAAGPAADPGDRAACDQAAICARRICELLGGAGP